MYIDYSRLTYTHTQKLNLDIKTTKLLFKIHTVKFLYINFVGRSLYDEKPYKIVLETA
jgi:hypothetical protein